MSDCFIHKTALTGVIGAGKTTAGRLLAKHNLPFISLDALAQQALEPGEKAYKKLLSLLGGGYLNEDKSFNRALTAKKIFQDKKLLSQFESVIHPIIMNLMKKEEKKALNTSSTSKKTADIEKKMIVYEVPLLFEKNLNKLFDTVIVLALSPEKQLYRLQKSRKWNKEDLQLRLQHHIPQEDKIKKADYVIWNDSSLKNLEIQLIKCIEQIKKTRVFKAAGGCL